jgi:hypothetical protein
LWHRSCYSLPKLVATTVLLTALSPVVFETHLLEDMGRALVRCTICLRGILVTIERQLLLNLGLSHPWEAGLHQLLRAAQACMELHAKLGTVILKRSVFF